MNLKHFMKDFLKGGIAAAAGKLTRKGKKWRLPALIGGGKEDIIKAGFIFF